MSDSANLVDTRLVAVVDGIDHPTQEVVTVSLTEQAGAKLPTWEPGAHIDLIVGDGLIRQYSLCGDPADRHHYRLGVLNEPDGRGGSAAVHQLAVGDRVEISEPRNHFRLLPAPSYLFIAGGIGITPLMPMMQAATSAGADWKLAYGGRRRESIAFGECLHATYGDRVALYPQDECGLLDVEGLLSGLVPGSLVYTCGPEPLLNAVESVGEKLAPGTVHVERFAAKEIDEPVRTEGFTVWLAKSELALTVPPDRSILEVVTAAGIEVSTSCEDGICGTCETRVLAGTPDHRDSVLDEAEKEANDAMMICVSRACGDRLELDL
ncbi:PDR/VanB family oxidoreductase [Gordonia sp. KTR9]|uniref:PDR/VanB family oxidoreductase n=1 Tax=Gordonia sp. KTR9 TaxID=337191 RepID=UPI00027DD89E|nr:PDR/VanB family oxidoreductase [Gordonia sp. KTR9]AFR47374.1 Flavodoxin reductases (ferredoxin-NADPH reductases) family 1 [Gordonia sp. KTR9]